MLFQVDCLLPIHLFDLIFYLAPSSATYFSVILFSLTYCIYGLLSAGCRIAVPLPSGFFPLVSEVGSDSCAIIPLRGNFTVVLVVRVYLRY